MFLFGGSVSGPDAIRNPSCRTVAPYAGWKRGWLSTIRPVALTAAGGTSYQRRMFCISFVAFISC